MAENLKITPFIVGEDHMSTGEQWNEWLDELELEMRFFGITDDARKKDALMIYGGREIRRLERCLPDPESGNKYEKLKSKLSEYFAPQRNKWYSRYKFLQMKPEHGESTASYTTRLRQKAIGCDFQNEDERILEHLMQTTENEELIRKVIYKKLNLKETLESMQLIEDTMMQVHDMNDRDTVARVRRRNTFDRRQRQHNGVEEHPTYERCKYCNRRHPRQKEQCPAWGKICNNCNRKNHFAVVCKDDELSSRGSSNDSRRGVSRVETVSDEDSDGDVEQFMKHLKIGKVTVSNKKSLPDGERKLICSYCGREGIHKRKEECEGYGKRCRNCKRRDHLERVCRNKNSNILRKFNKRKTRTDRSISSSTEDSDDEYIGDHITNDDYFQ